MSLTAHIWIEGERWEMRECGPGYFCEKDGCPQDANHYLVAFERGGRTWLCDECLRALEGDKRLCQMPDGHLPYPAGHYELAGGWCSCGVHLNAASPTSHEEPDA